MKILVAGQKQVEKLLPMRDCIRAMEKIFTDLATGKVALPGRTIIKVPARDDASIAIMPAFKQGAIAAKVMTIYPGNTSTRFETHQGAVLLFDSINGSLLAVIDSTSITALRTAAVSAVATKLLARPEANSLAILGSGAQAFSHLRAMTVVRKIKKTKVWSRNFAHAKYLASKFRNVVAVRSAFEAVKDADLICTTTSSRKPILKGKWIRDGAHINAVGAYTKDTRELDSDSVRKSFMFVDRLESAMAEAGEFLIPKARGLVGDSHIKGEIGDLLVGRVKGRTGEKQVTLFKSLGLAAEDLAAAEAVYKKCLSRNRGRWIDFGMERILP